MKSIGPTVLKLILADYGLALVKIENNQTNLGKTPELVACEKLDIKLRTHSVEWIS